MPIPETEGTVSANRRLLVDDVYDRILAAIYAGQFAPGEKLVDSELCAWLGTSRTPIRQALARLETQGLVETAANRWTRVTPINASRYRKSVPVVASLYRIAAIDAAPNVSRNIADELRSATRAMNAALSSKDNEAMIETTLKLGRMLVNLADNPVLSEALQTIMPRTRRINAAYTRDLPTVKLGDIVLEAIDALATGDAKVAGQAWYHVFETTGLAIADRLDEDSAAGKFDLT